MRARYNDKLNRFCLPLIFHRKIIETNSGFFLLVTNYTDLCITNTLINTNNVMFNTLC